MNSFSDYIVYVDESGDHGLKNVNPAYPVFVLSFCIFEKSKYISQVVAKMKALKFNTFGHDLIILHEREIRKKEGDFSKLGKQERESFINAVSTIINEADFTIVAVVIRKELLKNQYIYPANPYHLALQFGLERVYKYISSSAEELKKLYFVFESRGMNEDQELELEFRRFRDGENIFHKPVPFLIQFADKKVNSDGLQFADMTARPIGMSILRKNQTNRAFDILKTKLHRDGMGKYLGAGLKVFP